MTPRLRSRLVFALPVAAYVAIYFVDRSAFHPSGDGYYSWLFARSLAFDGDLDFGNDYALCGDPFSLGVDRGTGRADNPFYAGPAVFWLPPLLVLRGVYALLFGSARAAHASCGGWMTALPILAGPLAGALSVWLAYRAACLVARPASAAWTALLFAFTSPLFPYSTSVAHYSHVYLTLVVAVVVFASFRAALGQALAGGFAWVATAMAVAVLCRSSAALYVIVPASAVAARLRSRGRVPWKLGAGAASGVALGLVLTAALYEYLYGRWLVVPQGPDFVHLGHAQPLLLLFAVHGGFFFWMPAAWLALVGVGLAVRQHRLRVLTLGCAVAACAELVVSSAALDWEASWTLGARRLLPLTPLVIVFAAMAVDRVASWSGWRGLRRAGLPRRSLRGAAAVVVLLALVNNIPAATTVRGDESLSQAALYGAWSPLRPFWTLCDRAGVDLAILPAEAWFSARYRLPAKSYRDVIRPRYTRSYRTLVFEDDELDLRSPWVAGAVRGGAWSARGLSVVDEEAHFVFTAEWPFATDIRLLVASDGPATLGVAWRGPRGQARFVGAAEVSGGAGAWVDLPLPAGAFDSGLDEWVFRASGAKVTILAMAIVDRTPRVPHG